MNTTTNQNINQGKQLTNNKKRPEQWDDLDSRGGEEQLAKGDDVTHNTKEVKGRK
ncbi:MAG: hypothetical protein ABIR81_01370 [Ginsengibacter sp.]